MIFSIYASASGTCARRRTKKRFEYEHPPAHGLFGLDSGAALVTVVGVLVEVPVMLSLVAFANRTQAWFPKESVEMTPTASP